MNLSTSQPTTKPLVISQHWADKVSDTATSLAELKQRLLALETLPAQVTLVSAGEVSPLLDPDVVVFYRWLSNQCQVHFISAACVSVHAAILDFYHSQLEHTLVITLELGQSLQQGCLNSLGIGNGDDQDGLEVVPSIGFIQLQRQISHNGLVIEQCQIFNQQIGMIGTPRLISELYCAISDLPQQVLPVSFDISSQWGKTLLRGLDSRLQSSRRSHNWLASIETAQAHYLSAKPLLELQLYRRQLNSQSLLLLTLGGGGRVGFLQLSSNRLAASKLPNASFETLSLSADISGFKLAQQLEQNHSQDSYHAYYEQIRTTLKYPRSRYRGIPNHYFKWQADHCFNSPLEPQLSAGITIC